MVHQPNLIRPTSTSYQANTNYHQKTVDDEVVLKRRTSALILTLIATVIFLFLLSLFLLCALVFLGRSLAHHQSNQQDITSYFIDSNHFDKIKTNLLLPNIKIDSSRENRVEVVEADKNFNKFNQNLSPKMQKVIEQLTFRLPRQIHPISYNIFLHPNLKSKKFAGNVEINFNISETLSVIPLHSKFLNVTTNKLTKTLINGMEAIPLKTSFEYDPLEYWVVEPENPLAPGDYTIDLAFNGNLHDKIVGFYASNYFDKSKNESRTIATSKFEPTFARQAFPCFDEPAMKAAFKITLIRPKDDGYSALSNMPVEKEEDYETGLVKTIFKESVAMSTYLTVFIVSDFESIEKEVSVESFPDDNFTLRAFATPAQKEKLQFALDTGVDVIKFYIKYFNIPYPLPKLDMAAIPDFVSGAMETWGLVTYRETNLIYDPSFSSTSNKQRVAAVISHEFAHMWFGNLVTMKWWSDLFLNEGFASYIEFKGIQAAHPTWQMNDQFTIDTMHGIMNLDATLGSHPIVVKVETPDQITEIFDGITYNKGASIIRMLEDFIGEENFRNGVTNYLNANKFGNADTSDLLKHLQSDEIDVSTIMDTWTRQSGYPVVNVEKIDDKTFRLVQKRFFTDPNSEGKDTMESDFQYRWSIPITYFTSADRTVKRDWFNFDDKELIVTVEGNFDFVKFNYDQIGYYRVNYEGDMWKALNAALESDISSMSVLDRAHLLHDAFSLAAAQQLPYSTALEMTKYLKKETSFVPWDVASSKLKGIRNLLYSNPKLYGSFKNYAIELVNDAYKSVNWTVSPADNGHLDNWFRTTILDLACSMGHPDCLNSAAQLFREWMQSPENRPNNPDLKSIIYFYGMQEAGNEKYWDTMFDLFVKEQDAQEKVKLMSGLSAIQDRVILRKFIMIADDPEGPVRSQDFFSCMSSIASNRNGEDIVWEYVRENWPNFVKRFGLNERSLGRMIPSITSKFSTQTRLEEIHAFFGKYPEAGAGANARKEAIETVQNNINWLSKNLPSINIWLDENSISNKI